MMKILKFGFALTLIVLIAVGIGGYLYWDGLKTYGKTSLGQAGIAEVTIPKGKNPKAVARILEDKGIIQDMKNFTGTHDTS